jgi:hypothetical protein
VLGIFGTLHPGHDHAGFVAEQLRVATGQGQRLALFTVGRTGAAAPGVLAAIERREPGKILVHQFGEHRAEDVSGFLLNLDFGVAASPSPFLGKSGALAAMRRHGLPVLAPHRMNFPDFAEELGPDPDGDVLERPSSDFDVGLIAAQLAAELAQ